MSEVLFNGGETTGSVMVQNEHYDEVFDVSQDEGDVSINEGGDFSPLKRQFDLNQSNDNELSIEDHMSVRDSKTERPTNVILPPSNTKGDGTASNTFYDEQFEVNDDVSVETTSIHEGHNEGKSSNNLPTIQKKKLDAHYKQENFEASDIDSNPNQNPFTKDDSGIHDVETHLVEDPKSDLSPELKELFQCINDYKPKDIKIQPQLKCFIPPYIPSIGEVDPFLKIPRPDQIPDGLGITVIDEPSTKQSDGAVLELQLKAQLKKKRRKDGSSWFSSTTVGQIRSIENASKNIFEIDKWIKSVQDLHISKPISSSIEVRYKDPNMIPSLEDLMKSFPGELKNEMKKITSNGDDSCSDKNTAFIDPNIDLTLEEYTKIICSLLDVPIIENNLVKSLHQVFNLLLQFQKDLIDDAVSIL